MRVIVDILVIRVLGLSQQLAKHLAKRTILTKERLWFIVVLLVEGVLSTLDACADQVRNSTVSTKISAK